MQSEHLQPLAQTGLRHPPIAGAPQGSQAQGHPHTLGAGGSALSVSQSVSVHDLRMASQNVTGFQQPRTQHYRDHTELPQNARAGPSGHPNPGQNVQNVGQGYYRNAQAAPGPVRSNSTPHAQYAPYPQPQYNNGYAQVIGGHGHYPAPPANHTQSLPHDGRRAFMPSLNAGPSETNQARPTQMSQSSNTSGGQSVPGPSSMPRAPEPPRPHQQPHGPERNPTVPASAPAPPRPQHPQTPQPPGPSQPHNALPTPPTTSAGPSNAPSAPVQDVMALMVHSANQRARSILLPVRNSVADSLTAAHMAFTQELANANAMFVKSETKAVEVQVRLAALRDDFAQACAERDCALERCEQLKKEREVALEDIRKMNENLPKLVVEHYQLKADHDALRQEVVTLRETNAQLREKASLALQAALQYRTQVVPPSLLPHPTEMSGVKLEFPGAMSGGAGSAPPVQVKEERVTMKEANSPTDIDDDVAFALVRDFKVRKQKHRDQAEAEHERPHSISGPHPPPPSEAATAPSFMHINPPPSNVPPTPPAEVSPWSQKISLNNTPIAQTPPTHTPNVAQSSGADTSSREPKPEEVDGSQSALLSSIPELGHLDITGELDIIDLTLDFEMTDSPANFTADLPPLSDRAPESDPTEERKRTVEPEWNDRQETPNKKQRTEGGVSGSATKDIVMEGGDSQEINEAFLCSLIEVASQETSRVEAEPTPPAPPIVPPTHEDGQDTEPSTTLGAERRSNGSNDQGSPLPEQAPQPVTNGVPIPPTGLSTPPSPSPTAIHPPIPRPAHRSESQPQQAPNFVVPAPVFSASVAPAVSSASSPTRAIQRLPVSACPPPTLSAPAPSPPSLPATSSPSLSSSAPPPPSPPKQPISTSSRPLPLSLSVSTSSSSRTPPKLPPASPSVPPLQVPPVTPVVNALAGINLSLPSPTNAVHLPTEIPVASPLNPEPPNPEPPQKKLGINHIDLVYRRVGFGYYQCRFCERRHKEVPGCPSTKFVANAPGHILIEHVEKAHPLSVQPMVDMTPEDIRETRLRLQSTDKDNASAIPKKRKSSG